MVEIQTDRVRWQGNRRVEEPDSKAHKAWWVDAVEKVTRSIDQYGLMIIGTFATRAFFVTSRGRIVTGPYTVQDGDDLYFHRF